MKVRYIGADYVTFIKNKVYDVLSVEKGWYRLMSEVDESYLLPPEVCEVVEGSEEDLSNGAHG